jgi:spore coat protein CotH
LAHVPFWIFKSVFSMKKSIISSLFISVFLFYSCDLEPYSQPSDDLTELPVLDVIVTHDNLVKLQSNKHINLEIPAQFKYKGENYSGGFRAAGARSRDFFRWSYRVRLDEDQYIEDNNVFNLSVQIHDETMLITTVVIALYQKIGFAMFKSKHAFLRINNKDVGLYPMFEKVDREFFKRRGLKLSELYKAGSQLTLSFNEAGHPSLQFDKEYPNDDNFNTLINLYRAVDLTTVDNIDEILAPVLDIDLYLKYHAMTTVINNPDAFENNFFLWKDSPAAPLKILPWDFDLAFNKNRDVGLYGGNAIINKLLKNEHYFNQYKAELTDIVNNVYTEEFTYAVIDSAANHIREGYNLDPFLGGIYNFDDKVSEMKDYITNRRTFYLQELENFTFSD